MRPRLHFRSSSLALCSLSIFLLVVACSRVSGTAPQGEGETEGETDSENETDSSSGDTDSGDGDSGDGDGDTSSTTTSGDGDGDTSSTTTSGDGDGDGDTDPDPIEDGCFDHDGDAETVCRPWTVCQRGQYVSVPGTENSDRTCDNCPSGTYSDALNLDECTVCPTGSYASAEGAAQCELWTVCSWEETVDEPGTATNDLTCKAGSLFREVGTAQMDYAAAMAIDSDGNVFVAGSTYGDLDDDEVEKTDTDLLIAKYDKHGDLLWARTWGILDRREDVSEIATDSSGNLYLVGSVGPYSAELGLVLKLNPNGDDLWSEELDGGSDTIVTVRGIAVDHLDDVYVTGGTDGLLGDDGNSFGYLDVFVRKYSSDKEVVWTQQFGGTQSEAGDSIAVSAQGRVFVVGETTSATIGNVNNVATSSIFVAMIYQTNLSALGVHLIGDPYGNNQAVRLRMNQKGQGFIAGTALDGKNSMLLTHSIGSDGHPAWASPDIIDGPGYEHARDLALDGAGNPVVFGYSTSSVFDGELNQTASGFFVRKLTTAGDKVWTHLEDWNVPLAGAIGPDGHVFVLMDGQPLDDLGSTDQQMLIGRLNDPPSP